MFSLLLLKRFPTKTVTIYQYIKFVSIPNLEHSSLELVHYWVDCDNIRRNTIQDFLRDKPTADGHQREREQYNALSQQWSIFVI